MASDVLYGRSRELAALEATLARSIAGEGGSFFLSGEPGIGKTRLAEELANLAQHRGAKVFWARATTSEDAPACGPWIQVLRACVQVDVGFTGERDAHDLAPLLRGEAIVALLQRLSRENPLVLVFDDLDASDRASLNLLLDVARALRGLRVFVLGTYRELEARQGPESAELLAQLAQEGTLRPLSRLDQEDVAQWLARVLGAEPARATASAVFAATEGNPLLVDALAQLLLSRGGAEHGARFREMVALGQDAGFRDFETRARQVLESVDDPAVRPIHRAGIDPHSHTAERALARVGTVVHEYRIVRLLGIGGMAAVYAATDRDGRGVAIKFMHDRFRDDPKILHFFRREATVANRVGHAGAIPILAHDVDETGCAFLVMPLVEGETLRARWERANKTLPAAEVAVFMADVLDVLASAHAKGIIHRDIKPENLFLTAAGHTCVLDFGIARTVDVDGTATMTGSMIGTPAFMPPEQALGNRDAVGPHSDCWAVGATIFTLLSGEFVHRADSAQAQLAAAATRHARSLRYVAPEAPSAIVRFVDKALAFDASERWPSAREMREALLVAFEEALGKPFLSLATRARAALVEELSHESESTFVHDALRVGRRVSAAAATPSGAALTAGEQRMICVILAASSPGDANRQARLRDVGARFEANVEWQGERTVLVIRAPSKNTVDHVVLAARCALAIQAEWDGGPAQAPALAICTGRAELRDATSVGAIVERAAEMVRRAPAASIMVDDVATRLLELRFEVAEGRLLRQRAAPARTLLGRPSPFVGRDREMGNLQAILEACLEDRRSSAALLTGPAGIGKSRLVHEFLASARERHPEIAVWSASADPVTGGAPLWLLAQALRDAHIEGHIPGVSDANHDDVRALFSELMNSDAGTHVAATGTVTPTDPALRAERFRRGFLATIASECARHPLVIVLDDLQWADGASLRFFDAALGHVAEAPLLVIGVARPEIRDTFPWLWGSRRLEELRLPNIRARAAVELARHVLGAEVSDTTIERVVACADGNSFYLEELLRTVAEGRGDALPETVLAMATARLDVLDPAARQRLRAGSVFGESFTEGDVDALLDGSMAGEPTSEGLSRLVDQEVLVRQHGDDREPVRYRFRHGYLRDAAYAMLTDADRVLGHRLAAEWLERSGRTEPAVIAEHFEWGQDARAAVHFFHAARRAMRRSDPEGAIELATRGMRSPGAARETLVDLQRAQAEGHALRGDLGAVANVADALMASTEPGSKAWWTATARSIQAAIWLGPPARGRRSLRQLRASIAKFGKFPTYAQTVGTLLPLIYSAGAHEFAEPLYQSFLPDAVRISDRDPLTRGMLQRAASIRALIYGDDPWDAIQLARTALKPFEEAGDTQRWLYVQGEIALYLGDIADFAAHEAENRRLLELTAHMGLGPTIALGFWAYNLVELGRITAARELVDSSLTRAVESNFRVGEGTVRAARAMLLLQDGRLEEAEQEAGHAVRLAMTVPRFAVLGFTALIRARLARGRIAAALRASRAAMTLVTPPRSVGPTEVGVRLARADALRAAGDVVGARSEIHIARSRVLARAARCNDLAARRRYLEAAPAVAITLARAEQWLDSESGVPSTKKSGY